MIDTIGAGDTHVGAFIAALARGLDPGEACRGANAAAASVVTSRGQVSPPRLEQLRAIRAGDAGHRGRPEARVDRRLLAATVRRAFSEDSMIEGFDGQNQVL